MKLRFSLSSSIGALLCVLASSGGASARQDTNRAPAVRPQQPNRISAELCLTSSSRAELDINNVRAMVLNGGDMWWDFNNPRYEVPKVTDPNLPKRNVIFAGAIWVGGVDASNTLYTAAQTYRQGAPADAGFWPGPLDATGTTDKDICAAWNNHSKINRTDIDLFLSRPASSWSVETLPTAVKEWPGRGNPYLTRPRLDQELAPFIDVNLDEIYDPLTGDYPDIRGDQAIWWVINDVGGVKVPLSDPIGLEISTQAFAFQTNDFLNNMTFYRQKITNKSSKTLLKTWFGQWVDPDLGFFNDDFVGCDVGRGLGICYNGDNFDEGVTGYGANPFPVGVDFFEGPIADVNDSIDNDRDAWKDGVFYPDSVDEPGEKIIMSNFVYYNNDFSANGNPTESFHFYNYLKSQIHGTNPSNNDLKFGGNGVTGNPGVTNDPYSFMFPGGGQFRGGGLFQSDPYGYGYGNKYIDASKDPLAGNRNKGVGGRPPFTWSEDISGNVPADRRFLQSAGPFTLRPGAVNQITIGVIWGPALPIADDKAQGAFDSDFNIPDGPPAPLVQVSELDQQVVLALQSGSARTKDGRTITTETYSEEDERLPAAVRDKRYRFEGYLVYQLADANVTSQEVRDTDRARLVARGDVVNGVGQIVNSDFDTDVNAFVPKIMVNGTDADRGVFHTLNITSDLFASGNSRLVNFKKYHYIVIAYAYNGDNTTNSSGQRLVDSPYMEGRFSTKITVIPHKTQPEQNGTTLGASVGDLTQIKRIFGEGTGSHILEITDQDESDLIRDFEKRELTYESGKGPINVKVYDPKLVKGGKFTVKLSSRLTYLASTRQGGRSVRVGDRIVSTGQFATSESAVPVGIQGSGIPYFPNVLVKGGLPQIPGKAIIQRVVSREVVTASGGGTDTLVTLDIQMLNDHLGGTFAASIERYSNVNKKTGEDNGRPIFTVDAFEGYGQEGRSFKEVNDEYAATSSEYNLHDYWKLINEAGNVTYADRRVSEFNEQLVPDFGISIQVQGANSPGTQLVINRQAQFREASLTFTGDAWLTGAPYERPLVPLPGNQFNTFFGVAWLLPQESRIAGNLLDFDPNAVYANILPPVPGLGGTYAPYGAVVPVNGTSSGVEEAGGAYARPGERTLFRLRNVDIVYTPDRSKWTRVPVLQLGIPPSAPAANRDLYRLTKAWSVKPSINPDGSPSGERSPFPGARDSISRGMGWFPGYAIDLDRGIRLNMMFAENRFPTIDSIIRTNGQGLEKGTDLVWEPNSTKNGGRNFIYVLQTKYDKGVRMERAQDSLFWTARAPQFATGITQLYRDITWVGNPKLVAGKSLFQGGSSARVRLRVDRAFTSYPGDESGDTNQNPEYVFEMSGQRAVTNQRNLACDNLSLIRVVPNPYYAFSQYEEKQLDNIVKVTNLPRRCNITVYTLNGTLVRRLRKDDDRTFFDFNMKNENNLPIASGVYLFHISAPDLGCETIVKWFGVMRPIDLDTF